MSTRPSRALVGSQHGEQQGGDQRRVSAEEGGDGEAVGCQGENVRQGERIAGEQAGASQEDEEEAGDHRQAAQVDQQAGVAAQVEHQEGHLEEDQGGGAEQRLPGVLGLHQTQLLQGFQGGVGDDLAALHHRLARLVGAAEGGDRFAGALAGRIGLRLIVEAVGDDEGGSQLGDDGGLILGQGQADQGWHAAASVIQAVVADGAAHHLLEDGDGFLLDGLPALVVEGDDALDGLAGEAHIGDGSQVVDLLLGCAVGIGAHAADESDHGAQALELLAGDAGIGGGIDG